MKKLICILGQEPLLTLAAEILRETLADSGVTAAIESLPLTPSITEYRILPLTEAGAFRDLAAKQGVVLIRLTDGSGDPGILSGFGPQIQWHCPPEQPEPILRYTVKQIVETICVL